MTKKTLRNSWKITSLSSSVNLWRSSYLDFKRSGRILPSSPTACDDIPPIFTDNDRHDFFRNYPWISDSKVYFEYRLYEKRLFSIFQCLPIAILCCLGIMLQTRQRSSHPAIGLVSMVLLFVFGLLFLLGLLLNNPLLLSKFSKCNSLQVVLRKIQNSWLGGHIEDTLSVILTMIFGFSLFGYESTHANSVDFFMYISPIVCIICLRGVGIKAICLCYFIQVIFALTYCFLQTHSGDWKDFMIVIYSGFFLYISFSFKRFSRIMFLKRRNEIIQERLRRTTNGRQMEERIIRHREIQQMEERINRQQEIQIITTQAAESKSLMEKEREQLTALIGNVAHDLKTPLQSFRMELESLKKRISKDYCIMELSHEPSDSIDDDHPLNTIISLNAAVNFMSMAINRSIDFAKVNGDIDLVPSLDTFNIPDALSVSVNVMRHIQNTTTIIVNPFPPEICLNIISDKHWFSENVLCLLSNAVKYSNGGTINVIIELVGPGHRDSVDGSTTNFSLQAMEEGGLSCASSSHEEPSTLPSIRVSIEDTGIGLSEESRKSLFQPFKQVQRMAGGTGLGLFSLSNRMEALGGSRGVDSRRDGLQGSNFWFSFPYRPDPFHDEAYAQIPDELSSDSFDTFDKDSFPLNLNKPTRDSFTTDNTVTPKSPKRPKGVISVMLVDDSLTIIRVATRALRNKGYLVTTAHNGSAGLDRLIEGYEMFEFDFVLMDLQMPVMDGIESVSRYREFERKNREVVALATPGVTLRKRLPIIGMSANSDNATKQLALNAGMDLFIPKPFILSELEPLIYLLLQRKLPSFDGGIISRRSSSLTTRITSDSSTPVAQRTASVSF
mmetsp:Transcript_35721/g.33855  ORF Transcript_35721/g.33855 Transcript_35721/m.33855 type:complete len:838 (+) Transcript_35721:304-2817(+)